MLLLAASLSAAPSVRLGSLEVEFPIGHWLGLLTWAVAFTAAHIATSRRLPHRDPYILPVAAILSGWGLLTIWRLFPDHGLRQTLWIAFGAAVVILGVRLPSNLRWLRRYKYLFLSAGLALTALTLILGTNPLGNGPRMWLGCCGLYFQPSEPLKLLLIAYLAAYLAGWKDRLNLPLNRQRLLPLLAPTLIMTGLALAVLLVQRDLGTATIFLFLYVAIVYLASGRLRIVLIGAVLLFVVGMSGYLLFDLVRLRVDAWLNPWLDPSDRSYQIVQSLIAAANGGILGRGLGLGSPGLVPVPHSDFIFISIFEETGLIGALGMLALIAMLAVRGLEAALRSPDAFRRFLGAGLTTYIAGQSILIIGGNLRLLPLTGVTLPFVSSGGSSLITTFISLLLLLQISNTEQEQPAALLAPAPYLHIGGVLLAGLFAAGLLAGWWSVFRAPDLLARPDDPRRAVAARYNPRGALLDRSNQVLQGTVGERGSYTRQYNYTALGPVLGYSHPAYGQAGLEAALDPWLRGEQGYLPDTLLWERLLRGYPPPGLNVRTSINLELQTAADRLLGDRKGALVLLNPDNGQILAIASHPTFNPNELDALWQELVVDEDAPLLNRATQGLYPAGAAVAPVLYANLVPNGLPPLPEQLTFEVEGEILQCASPGEAATLAEAVASGCPGAAAALGEVLGTEGIVESLEKAGLTTVPAARLPAAQPVVLESSSPEEAALGQNLSVSPLQMALTAASFSADGIIPAPHLATAVQIPDTGWTTLRPPGEAFQGVAASGVFLTAQALAAEGAPYWQVLAVAPNGPDAFVTWYLAGTLPDWDGTPLALAVLIEERAPSQAEAIGQELLDIALRR